MNNVLIKNDSSTEIVTVGNESDILYYIEKYMGMEFSDYVKEYYSEIAEKFKEENSIIKEKNFNYEDDLGKKNKLLYDTEESLVKLLDYMENSKRMNKQTIIDRLKELKIIIYSEL